MSKTLDYRAPGPPVRTSKLAISAFLLTLFPILHIAAQTGSFQAGRSLALFRAFIVKIPAFVPPWLGFILGIVALLRIEESHGRLRGSVLAILAIIIAVLWLLLLMVVLFLAGLGRDVLPHPN